MANAAHKTDIVIVGGGVLGLLSARQLAASGSTVTLIERGMVGQEASWAGGGILSPLYPWRYDPAVSTLALWSQSAYPGLVASLKDETGIDSQYSRCGLLVLDAPDEDEAMAWGQHSKGAMESMGREQFSALEPNLSDSFQQGLWMPEVANIRNPALLQALKASLIDEPSVRMIENCEMHSFSWAGSKINGLETSLGRIDCSKILICSGAWTAGLMEQLSVQLPIEPVKGQMLLIRAEPGLVRHIVLSEGRYVIPRNDGHVLVGSSIEKTGFEKNITEQAKRSLSDFAFHLIPRLRDYPIVKHWAGLRPGSPGGVPFIGAVPEHENVFVNAGHFRNGLVMAPASVKLITDLILGVEPDINPLPYGVER